MSLSARHYLLYLDEQKNANFCQIVDRFLVKIGVATSVWKQLDFIIEFATYRMKQPSMKQLTARPLISQKTVFKRAVMSCF